MDLTDTDRKHIARLQALHETGSVNLFTDVRAALHQLYDDEEAEVTYEWITDNFEYFLSGEWTNVDLNNSPSNAHDIGE